MPKLRHVVLADANGSATAIQLRTDTSGNDVMSSILAKSRAGLVQWSEGEIITGVPLPSASAYRSVFDVAYLTFADATGDLTVITLPAPHTTIFLADQQTVDSGQILTLIADVIAQCVTAAGNPVVSYVSGFRARRGTQPD